MTPMVTVLEAMNHWLAGSVDQFHFAKPVPYKHASLRGFNML